METINSISKSTVSTNVASGTTKTTNTPAPININLAVAIAAAVKLFADKQPKPKPSEQFCKTGELEKDEKFNQLIHNYGKTPNERCPETNSSDLFKDCDELIRILTEIIKEVEKVKEAVKAKSEVLTTTA